MIYCDRVQREPLELLTLNPRRGRVRFGPSNLGKRFAVCDLSRANYSITVFLDGAHSSLARLTVKFSERNWFFVPIVLVKSIGVTL